MIKAKSDILLSLGDDASAQSRQIVDDDEATAKNLWKKLQEQYERSNAQAVMNLRNKLEVMQLRDDGDWKNHVEKFTGVLGKRALYNVEVSDREKATKILQTLRESFTPLAVAY